MKNKSGSEKCKSYLATIAPHHINHRQGHQEIKNQSEKDDNLVVKMPFPSISKSVIRVERSLPKDSQQKKMVVKNIFENMINAYPRKKNLILIWTNIHKKTPEKQVNLKL